MGVIDAGASKHYVPGIASYGYDVHWSWILRCSPTVPAAYIRSFAGPGRRTAGSR